MVNAIMIDERIQIDIPINDHFSSNRKLLLLSQLA